MPDDIILTPELKAKIHEVYNQTPDLIIVTRKVFGNEELDGRTKEGRAVREYLVEQGLKFRTTKKDPEQEIILNDCQKNFIVQNSKTMTAFQMAKVLFPDKEISTVLAKECRTIIDYLREYAPDKIKDTESAIGVDYQAPATISIAVNLINKVAAQSLEPNRLSTQQKNCVESYLKFINSPRLVQIINTYGSD